MPLFTSAQTPGGLFWAAAAAVAFLCGSIPFGLLISRAKGVDIRKVGSGNIGATNVGRVLGKRYFYLCFALDFCKGLAPTLLAGSLAGVAGRTLVPTPDAWGWLATMVCAVLGHVFSPWIGFKGGKGVATSLGALLGVFPHLTLPGLATFAVWLAVLAVSRYISLSSIFAGAALPAISAAYWFALHAKSDAAAQAITFTDAIPFLAVSAALGALVIWTHRANIQRLRSGTEPKVGQRAKAPHLAH